MGSSATTAWKL